MRVVFFARPVAFRRQETFNTSSMIPATKTQTAQVPNSTIITPEVKQPDAADVGATRFPKREFFRRETYHFVSLVTECSSARVL